MASLESRLAVGGRRTLRWTSQSDSEEEDDDASSKQSFEERDDEAASIAEGSGWASDGPGKRWDLVDSEDDATAGMTRDGTMSGAATRRAAARFSGAQGGLADDAAAFHSVRSAEVARGASATAITAALVAGAEAAGLFVEARRAGYVCASGVVKGAHARAELQLCCRLRGRRRRAPRRCAVVCVSFLDGAAAGGASPDRHTRAAARLAATHHLETRVRDALRRATFLEARGAPRLRRRKDGSLSDGDDGGASGSLDRHFLLQLRYAAAAACRTERDAGDALRAGAARCEAAARAATLALGFAAFEPRDASSDDDAPAAPLPARARGAVFAACHDACAARVFEALLADARRAAPPRLPADVLPRLAAAKRAVYAKVAKLAGSGRPVLRLPRALVGAERRPAAVTVMRDGVIVAPADGSDAPAPTGRVARADVAGGALRLACDGGGTLLLEPASTTLDAVRFVFAALLRVPRKQG